MKENEGIKLGKQIQKMQQEIDKFLNSKRAMKLIQAQRYSDLEVELIKIRKRVIDSRLHDMLVYIGYFDGLITRKLVVKLYGMTAKTLSYIQDEFNKK